MTSRLKRAGRVGQAAALVAAVMMLAGCADRDDGGAPSLAPHSSSPDSVGIDEVSAAFQRVEGDQHDLAAAHFVAWTRGQTELADCMADDDFDYLPPDYVSPYADMPALTGHGSSQWVQPLRTTFHIDEQQESPYFAYANGKAPGPTEPDQDKPGYEEALKKCARLFDRSMTADSMFPKGYAELSNGMNEIAISADRTIDPASLKEYAQCMRDHELDLPYAYELTTPILARYAAAGPPPTDGRQGSPRWQSAVAFEHRVASADGDCRAEVYRAGMAVIAPQIAAFVAANGPALDDLDAQWADLVDQASTDPGWSVVESTLVGP